MVTLIGLSGSLRQGSFNSALLRSAAELMPTGTELRIATIRGIPLYDADVETSQPHGGCRAKGWPCLRGRAASGHPRIQQFDARRGEECG